MKNKNSKREGLAGEPEINMGDLRVTVRSEHIRKAEKGTCGHCPNSIAIKEAGKRLGVKNVITEAASIRFTVGPTRYIFPTPNIVQTFLHIYDKAMQDGLGVEGFIAKFKPFSYVLRQLRAQQITHRDSGMARKSKKRIRVTTDKRKKGKGRKARKMVASPTIIGGLPISLIGSRKRVHGVRAYAEAARTIFPRGIPVVAA
jgi:hypothetical protein